MSAPGTSSTRISTFSRVLAWIFLVLAVLGIAGWVFTIYKSPGSLSWGGVVLLALLIFPMCALFLFAALKGRSPRWLTSIETMYDREAERRGIPTKPAGLGRTLVFVVTTLVFGMALVAMGRSLELFDSETSWFAAAVFFAAWLIVVLILWRNLPKSASRTNA